MKHHPTFDHHRLDAFSVARQALQQGDAIARRLPRGYAALSDQLRRALLSAFLGIAEASSRTGSDRLARFRCARGEASEAAADGSARSAVRHAHAPGWVDSQSRRAAHVTRDTRTRATLEHELEHAHGLACRARLRSDE